MSKLIYEFSKDYKISMNFTPIELAILALIQKYGSQKNIAKILDVTPLSIQKWLSGTIPQVKNIRKICDILKIPMHILQGNLDEKTNTYENEKK